MGNSTSDYLLYIYFTAKYIASTVPLDTERLLGSMPNPPPRPTVLYDTERTASFDPLDAPDVDAVLRSKRKWYHSLARLELPLSRRWHMLLTGLSIGLSSVQANGVYSWPT